VFQRIGGLFDVQREQFDQDVGRLRKLARLRPAAPGCACAAGA
jgi:hypothetical protein